MIEVVGGFIARDGRVLLTQRRANQEFPFTWECPGGKVHGDESHHEALKRELHEELGIEVTAIAERSLFCRNFASKSCPPSIFLLFYNVCAWTGVPAPREGQGIGWFTRDEVRGLQFYARQRCCSRGRCVSLGVEPEVLKMRTSVVKKLREQLKVYAEKDRTALETIATLRQRVRDRDERIGALERDLEAERTMLKDERSRNTTQRYEHQRVENARYEEKRQDRELIGRLLVVAANARVAAAELRFALDEPADAGRTHIAAVAAALWKVVPIDLFGEKTIARASPPLFPWLERLLPWMAVPALLYGGLAYLVGGSAWPSASSAPAAAATPAATTPAGGAP